MKNKRKRIQSGEKVPVRISKSERDLIIEHTFIDDDLIRLLRVAEVSGRNLKVMMTLDDLEDLLGHVAFTANHAENPKLEKKFDTIYKKLAEVEDSYIDPRHSDWEEN